MTSTDCLFFSLFLVPLSLFLVSFWIQRLFKKSDSERERNNADVALLVKEKKNAEDKATIEWRNQMVKKQDEIKIKVDEVARNLTEKVDWNHCGDTERSIRNAIEKVDDRVRNMAK